MRLAVIAASAVSVALLGTAPSANAEPVVPQAGTPCSAEFADAMTWQNMDEKVPLRCVAQPATGYEWDTVPQPFPASDRWLSYGPQMKLHGQGLRNPNITSGEWTATPQSPDSRCRAEQLAVVSAGEVGSPQIDEAAAGQRLSFEVLPKLFSITMSGYCLWTKVDS